MHIIIYTSTLLNIDQVAALRLNVRAQLDDGKEVVVLPPGCTMEMLSSVPAGVFSTTSAIPDEVARRYKAMAQNPNLLTPLERASIKLNRRRWPERFWLSYKGWRKDMGVLDSLRSAWRISR